MSLVMTRHTCRTSAGSRERKRASSGFRVDELPH
jgi:hypothetical protein